MGDAVAQVAPEQRFADFAEGFADRGDLHEYLRTVAVLVDHALHTAHLPLDSFQPAIQVGLQPCVKTSVLLFVVPHARQNTIPGYYIPEPASLFLSPAGGLHPLAPRGMATNRSRARTLLLIWSAALLAPLLAATVAALCCRLPFHHLLHQSPGMEACNHDAPSLEDRDTETALSARPSSTSPPRSDAAIARADHRSDAHRGHIAGRSPALPWMDAGPPGPDHPSPERLSLYRI